MKSKILAFTFTIAFACITASCMKEPTYYSLIGDKDKIDIKGSLMGGDMRSPDLEAGYLGKTVYVYFHKYMDYCTVTISNAQDSVLFCEETPTYPNAEVRYYMGDQPNGRYHLVISNGTDEAEGWFNNFKIVAIKPHNK